MATTELIELAIETSKHAYVPYSHFPIGAVLVAKDGSVYTGVNIENGPIAVREQLFLRLYLKAKENFQN